MVVSTNVDERILMQFSVWINDNHSIFSGLVVQKVQMEGQLKDIEAKIQFQRGVIAAFEKASEIVKDVQLGKEIEELPLIKFGGGDHQRKVAEYLDKKFEEVR